MYSRLTIKLISLNHQWGRKDWQFLNFCIRNSFWNQVLELKHLLPALPSLQKKTLSRWDGGEDKGIGKTADLRHSYERVKRNSLGLNGTLAGITTDQSRSAPETLVQCRVAEGHCTERLELNETCPRLQKITFPSTSHTLLQSEESRKLRISPLLKRFPRITGAPNLWATKCTSTESHKSPYKWVPLSDAFSLGNSSSISSLPSDSHLWPGLSDYLPSCLLLSPGSSEQAATFEIQLWTNSWQNGNILGGLV